jgi:hypothetical protein
MSPVTDHNADLGQVLSILKDVVKEIASLKQPSNQSSSQHVHFVNDDVPTNTNQNRCNNDQPAQTHSSMSERCATPRSGSAASFKDKSYQRGYPRESSRATDDTYWVEDYWTRDNSAEPEERFGNLRFDARRDQYPSSETDYQRFPRQRSNFGARNTRDNRNIKIPAFDGKNDWSVWVARFEAIALRMGWSNDDKLDQMLPRIEGQAADFVFTQLHPSMLTSYSDLIDEITSRYRVIETPKLFASRFSRRSQRVGETAEEFAAELKVLYDKAHGFRDKRTRNEDLLRRFLDGLRDDDIRFEVEYNKEPGTIDEAVFHVVNFIQTKNIKDRRAKENLRRTSDDATVDEERAES